MAPIWTPQKTVVFLSREVPGRFTSGLHHQDNTILCRSILTSFAAHHAHTRTSHYQSPFRMVRITPGVSQSLQAFSHRLFEPLGDILARHPTVVTNARLTCLLCLLLLLLLLMWDVYCWMRSRDRRNRNDRLFQRCLYVGFCEDDMDEKSQIRRRWTDKDGLLVPDLDLATCAVKPHQDTALVVREPVPGASLVRVPEEPLFLGLEAHGADSLAPQD